LISYCRNLQNSCIGGEGKWEKVSSKTPKRARVLRRSYHGGRRKLSKIKREKGGRLSAMPNSLLSSLISFLSKSLMFVEVKVKYDFFGEK